MNKIPNEGGTIALSWGKWGGFYFERGWMWRLCLGWVALTFLPMEIDDLMKLATNLPEIILDSWVKPAFDEWLDDLTNSQDVV